MSEDREWCVPTKSEVGKDERTQSERHVTNGTEDGNAGGAACALLDSRDATEGETNFFLLFFIGSM